MSLNSLPCPLDQRLFILGRYSSWDKTLVWFGPRNSDSNRTKLIRKRRRNTEPTRVWVVSERVSRDNSILSVGTTWRCERQETTQTVKGVKRQDTPVSCDLHLPLRIHLYSKVQKVPLPSRLTRNTKYHFPSTPRPLTRPDLLLVSASFPPTR